MKNILNEKPSHKGLNNRMIENVTFVSDVDIRGKMILDIGCGFGWCELNFIKRGAKKICGIELTEGDLYAAKKGVRSKNAEFKIGSALDIPYPDNSFDTIVAWEVIEHIPKNTELKMFSEVRRVLKKGGVFYLSTPYDHILSKVGDPAWWLIGHRHYSIKKLEEYGKKRTLKMEKEETRIKGKLWSIFGVVHLYAAKWIFRLKTSPFTELIERKEREEYKTNDGFANIFVKYKKMK